MSFVVACGSVGGGQEARWRPLQCFFFFHVKTPVTASSPSLFFCFLSHLFFLSIPFFFLFLPCFFSLFFFSSSPPLLLFCSLFLCIYRQKHGERRLLSLSSHGIVVGWSGRPLCSRPRTARGARPLCFSPCGSHGSELRQVEGLCRRLFKAFRESKRREKQWNEIFFFPCLAHLGEQEDPQCRSKRHRLGLFFFLNSG